jgi:WD40 repeat protein
VADRPIWDRFLGVFIVGSHQNIAMVHDGGTTECGRPYFVMELVHGVPITDGERLASASEVGKAKVWDAQTGQELLSFEGHATSVFKVAFSPDGKRLATVSGDQTVKVWDAQTGQELLSCHG